MATAIQVGTQAGILATMVPDTLLHSISIIAGLTVPNQAIRAQDALTLPKDITPQLRMQTKWVVAPLNGNASVQELETQLQI